MKFWLQRLCDGGAGLARGCWDGLREIWNVFALIAKFFDPRQIPRMIRRDTGTVVDSGKLLATSTSAAATDVAAKVALSPLVASRWLITAPKRFFVFIITRSPLQLAVGTLVAVIGATVVAWPAASVIHERRLQSLANEQYRQMELFFERADFKGVQHNLDVLIKTYPNDEKIAARRHSMDTGIALPNDLRMARLLMRHHYGSGRLDDAVREARTYLAVESKDWESLLVAADGALRHDKRAEATKLVQALPRAHETREPPSLWSCCLAARTFRALADQNRLDDLIAYLCENYVSLMRRLIAVQVEPAAQLQLIEVFNICMTALNDRPDLQRYWVPAQELSHRIANSPDATVPVLINLGVFQEIQREVYLKQMAQMRLITAEQTAEYSTEIDNRLKAIWRRVREGDPKSYLGYLGPAMQLARADDLRGAAAEIEAGITACGPIPELIEKKAEVLRRLDPAGGLAFLEESLAGKQVSPAMWRVVAEAALAARRPDKALEATKKALQQYPNLPWAIRMAAEIHIDQGRPEEAALILNQVDLVIEDAGIGALYVRSLAASGKAADAEQFLLRAVQRPDTRLIVLSGADVLTKLGHEALAANVLRRFIAEEPTNAAAEVVLGDTLRQAAEKQDGGWNRELIDDALRAYRHAILSDRNQLRIANNIAWLELVALDLPKVAYESAQPLRAAGGKLPADMLETVGATHVGIAEYEAGRALLEKAIGQGGARASTLAFLALAYHGLNRAEEARQNLDRAVRASKSGPREAELVQAIRRRIERGVK